MLRVGQGQRRNNTWIVTVPPYGRFVLQVLRQPCRGFLQADHEGTLWFLLQVLVAVERLLWDYVSFKKYRAPVRQRGRGFRQAVGHVLVSPQEVRFIDGRSYGLLNICEICQCWYAYTECFHELPYIGIR